MASLYDRFNATIDNWLLANPRIAAVLDPTIADRKEAAQERQRQAVSEREARDWIARISREQEQRTQRKLDAHKTLDQKDRQLETDRRDEKAEEASRAKDREKQIDAEIARADENRQTRQAAERDQAMRRHSEIQRENYETQRGSLLTKMMLVYGWSMLTENAGPGSARSTNDLRIEHEARQDRSKLFETDLARSTGLTDDKERLHAQLDAKATELAAVRNDIHRANPLDQEGIAKLSGEMQKVEDTRGLFDRNELSADQAREAAGFNDLQRLDLAENDRQHGAADRAAAKKGEQRQEYDATKAMDVGMNGKPDGLVIGAPREMQTTSHNDYDLER